MPHRAFVQDATHARNDIVGGETRGLIDDENGVHWNSIIESFRDLIIVESQGLTAVTSVQ
jgi:hypothetical protein